MSESKDFLRKHLAMKQFFETDHGNEKLSALLKEISRPNNTLIMMGKRPHLNNWEEG